MAQRYHGGMTEWSNDATVINRVVGTIPAFAGGRDEFADYLTTNDALARDYLATAASAHTNFLELVAA